ncbi:MULTISPECIES: ornithine cyclodeaminase family protein [Oceanotoga]|jgi:ornithine cyclodeaminase|uniref:Ornithine cyclodeaminase n=1 Tax=Oceanotoga teriensis TaxID=515440 RepID=A0AA45HHV9_9BACT|nr:MULTISPECIES: ornithine cyclodeaminase family protein [Oceanotoga]MDN5341906.1 hypothetical protein [Oceanotoga sp.]MDO7976582.1 ornithine cyclodeaminase family protein [Oceanotoga teriensis]PWJ88250.1 ornithine cyclodeaminase [Oceanotoga teriensis]
MINISKEKIKEIFNMKDAIESNKEAFILHSKNEGIIPLRTNIDIPKFKGQSLFMPGYIESLDISGIKIVSVFPENIKLGKNSINSTMILLSGKTGEVLSTLDGTYLTQIRTGAVAGAATEILSNKDSKIGALFGTGGQGECQFEAMLTARNLEEIRVFDIDEERCNSFCLEMAKKFSIKVKSCKTPKETVENADIITTATTSKKPVFDFKDIKKGAHINAIGSYTPEMQEIDENLIKNADKIYFDSKSAVLSESGDIIIPLKKHIISEHDFKGDIGEVLINKIEGRKNKEEITLFKSVGISILDIVMAKKIYEKTLKK